MSLKGGRGGGWLYALRGHTPTPGQSWWGPLARQRENAAVEGQSSPSLRWPLPSIACRHCDDNSGLALEHNGVRRLVAASSDAGRSPQKAHLALLVGLFAISPHHRRQLCIVTDGRVGSLAAAGRPPTDVNYSQTSYRSHPEGRSKELRHKGRRNRSTRWCYPTSEQ